MTIKRTKNYKSNQMMKKLLVYLMMGSAALLTFNSCKQEKTDPTVDSLAQADSLQKIIDQKDNEINDMMGTLNEIQEGFHEINQAENREIGRASCRERV